MVKNSFFEPYHLTEELQKDNLCNPKIVLTLFLSIVLQLFFLNQEYFENSIE